MTHEEATKNHLDGENSKSSAERETRLYRTGEDDDAFASLKVFVSKLNPSCSAFFQHPKQSVNTGNAVWYENRPLGVNKLGEMMKTISVGAKLSHTYTNHFVRAYTTAHGRLCRSWKVSPKPSQMHFRITNHRAHKFPPSLVLHSCKVRTEWPLAFRCRPQPQAFRVAFLTPVIFRATSRCFSAYRAALMTKSDLIFCSILFQICWLRSFDSAFKAIVSSRTSDARFKFDSGVILWTNHNSLLSIATNQFASFCIDNRLRQKLFSCLSKWGNLKKKGFFPYILILYNMKQIDSKLLCVCSVYAIDHRGRQNVVKTSVTHSAAPRVPLFCSYQILTSSVIDYWTDARQLGIYTQILRLCDFTPLIRGVIWLRYVLSRIMPLVNSLKS